jgi:hypothetical protein
LADFKTDTVRHSFVLPSFDAYYGPFERGGASTGRRWSHFPRQYAAPYGKRYGVSWLTPVDQSKPKRSTEFQRPALKCSERTPPQYSLGVMPWIFSSTYRVRLRRPSARHCASIRGPAPGSSFLARSACHCRRTKAASHSNRRCARHSSASAIRWANSAPA